MVYNYQFFFQMQPVAEIMGILGGLGPPQSAMSSENSGFRRLIDNRLTCRNYSKNSICKGILS